MDTAESLFEIHPTDEGTFWFPMAGVRVRMSVADDALTLFGGLVPWAAYIKHLCIVDALGKDAPVKRASPNAAPVYDIIQSFMLTALTDGRRLRHVERLREDPTIPEILGFEAVVSDDTVRRFFDSIDVSVGEEWVARHARPIWRVLPGRFVLDWDSSVNPSTGTKRR